MEKQKVGPCPKCGGFSQFYHKCGDVTIGYCVCERCGYKQRGMLEREEAVAKWNNKNKTQGGSSGKKKRIWDNYIVIAEVRKSDGIKFVVAAATRMGFRYINIREFYLRKKDNTWQPGRDGITIPLVAPLDKGAEFIKPFESMLTAITDAAKCAESMELMDEEKAIWS